MADPASIPRAPMVLTAQELVDLTGKRRAQAQGRVLDAMGIPYRQRPTGHQKLWTPVVLRIHVHVVPQQAAGPEPVLQP